MMSGASLSLALSSTSGGADGHSAIAASGEIEEMINTDGDTPSVEGEWDQIEHNRVFIYYRGEEYLTDAEQMQTYISFAEKHVHDLISIHPNHEVEWYVWPEEEYSNNQWTQVTHTDVEGGEFKTVEIHSLAPSDHDGLDPDQIGEWYRHGVVHEYFQIPMYRILVNNRGIANFNDSTPRWFSEGVPNFAAVHGTPESQNNYADRIDALGEQIQNGNGRLADLESENVYTVGTVLVQFMVDEWSWDHILRTLHIQADSWSETLENQFDVTRDEFEQRWLRYANDEFGANYDITDTCDCGNISQQNDRGNLREGTPTPIAGTPGSEAATRPLNLLALLGAIPAAVLLGGVALLHLDGDEDSGDVGDVGGVEDDE